MAFSSTGLVTVCASKSGNAPNMYLYKTTDTVSSAGVVDIADGTTVSATDTD
jgi:hypothetical protein